MPFKYVEGWFFRQVKPGAKPPKKRTALEGKTRSGYSEFRANMRTDNLASYAAALAPGIKRAIDGEAVSWPFLSFTGSGHDGYEPPKNGEDSDEEDEDDDDEEEEGDKRKGGKGGSRAQYHARAVEQHQRKWVPGEDLTKFYTQYCTAKAPFEPKWHSTIGAFAWGTMTRHHQDWWTAKANARFEDRTEDEKKQYVFVCFSFFFHH